MKVLIVDDEPGARRRVADLLAPSDEVEIVGEAGNGRDAVEMIRELRPDLVFLDVQMPGFNGIEVVREVGPENMPAVIFATAYDHYASRAFDLAAVDYLVKPYDDDRFEQALRRARKTLAENGMAELQTRLAAFLEAVQAPAETRTNKYLERIAVSMRGQMRIVPIGRIDFINASGAYAELHVGEDKFLIRESIQTLEEQLDPARFVRIHRGTIVRIECIDTLLFSSGGDYAVRLVDGRTLRVSRSRWDDLGKRLGVKPPGPE